VTLFFPFVGIKSFSKSFHRQGLRRRTWTGTGDASLGGITSSFCCRGTRGAVRHRRLRPALQYQATAGAFADLPTLVGDLNLDGKVDFTDAIIWSETL